MAKMVAFAAVTGINEAIFTPCSVFLSDVCLFSGLLKSLCRRFLLTFSLEKIGLWASMIFG